MKTLVIIDMQPFFLNEMDGRSLSPLIRRTVNLVRQARESRWHIVLVEYNLHHYFNIWSGTKKSFNEWTSTHKDIKKELLRYRKKHLVLKTSDDGGGILYNYIQKKNLPKDIVMCGVNTDCCVKLTSTTLLELGNMSCQTLNMTFVADCMRNTWQWNKQNPSTNIKKWSVYARNWENIQISSLVKLHVNSKNKY